MVVLQQRASTKFRGAVAEALATSHNWYCTVFVTVSRPSSPHTSPRHHLHDIPLPLPRKVKYLLFNPPR